MIKTVIKNNITRKQLIIKYKIAVFAPYLSANFIDQDLMFDHLKIQKQYGCVNY